jgi:hypothetical protein
MPGKLHSGRKSRAPVTGSTGGVDVGLGRSVADPVMRLAAFRKRRQTLAAGLRESVTDTCSMIRSSRCWSSREKRQIEPLTDLIGTSGGSSAAGDITACGRSGGGACRGRCNGMLELPTGCEASCSCTAVSDEAAGINGGSSRGTKPPERKHDRKGADGTSIAATSAQALEVPAHARVDVASSEEGGSALRG